MDLWCCQWARSLDGSQSSKICTWNIFSVQTSQAGSIFSPLRLPPLLSFWCLSVQNTAGSNIQGWVYGGGQNYERSWGKLSLSLGDNNWHLRLQQMTAAICLKHFGQTISLVPERNTTVSVNWFEHCQGLSLKVLISFFTVLWQIRSVRYNRLSFGKFSCSNIARIWPPAMMDHFVTWDYTLPPPPTLAKVKAIFFRFLTFLARDLRGLENIKVYFSFVNVSNTLGSSSENN